MNAWEEYLLIQLEWQAKTATQPARVQGVRENFENEIHRFFELLELSIESANGAHLDEILDDWSQLMAISDLETPEITLTPLVEQIFSVGYEIARVRLPASQALHLTTALLPLELYAFKHLSRVETRLHIQHYREKIETTRNDLEKLDKSKSDFISVAAHELKTPLTLIEGYTSMLRETLEMEQMDSQLDVLLNGIDTGSRRLRTIIDDMIDVSLIDNNLLELNFQPVWFNQLIDTLLREFSPTINQRNLKLVVNRFDGMQEMTFGDPERLYQAFLNLLSNAIKFTPDGGNIIWGGRKLPGFIEFTITDTGIGIAPDEKGRIFDKFHRLGDVSLHSTGKTKFKGGGPGLGLPITKGIIEAHGGAIWVESPGYDEVNLPGSTFHVLLPVLKTPPDDRLAKLFGSMVHSTPS